MAMTRRANSLVIISSLPKESGENQLAPRGPNAIPTAVAITSKIQINQCSRTGQHKVVNDGLQASERYNRCLTNPDTRPYMTINPPRTAQVSDTWFTIKRYWMSMVCIYKSSVGRIAKVSFGIRKVEEGRL
jgi:hypothetical protein